MAQPALIPDPEQVLQGRLRLKRLFLIALVASLTTGAVIAIGILLFGTFNQTNTRILGTLAALAVHSGIAMAVADSLERRRWPALSTIGLALFAVNFAFLVTCIWCDVAANDEERATLTTLTLIGAYVLAIPPAALREKRRWKPVPLIGMVSWACVLVMVAICLWSVKNVSEAFGKATSITAIVAFTLSHTCVLGRVPMPATLRRLLAGAIACAWLFGVMLSILIINEAADDFLVRLTAATGVLDACVSLALVILAKLKQITTTEHLESASARIEIRCPRCTKRQVVDAGASRCDACGLKLRIDIEEPRCPQCGYLLWELPERRCPECGASF